MRCYLSTQNSPSRQDLYETPTRGAIQAATLEALELLEDANDHQETWYEGPAFGIAKEALIEAIRDTLLPAIEEQLEKPYETFLPGDTEPTLINPESHYERDQELYEHLEGGCR